MSTRAVRIPRFDEKEGGRTVEDAIRFWMCGQIRAPRIPAEGVRTPMRTREDAGMCREVLPKRTAVDVMVVKPTPQEIKIVNTKFMTEHDLMIRTI